MGAGDYAAGFADIAGEDPIAVLSAARDLLPPLALAFDGETRTFLRDENGLLLSVHPIDQKVALALFIEQKKITSAPNTGSTLREIKYLDPQKVVTDATNRINRALNAVLKPGDIEIISLEVTQPSRWSISTKLEYRNLRDPTSRPRVLRVTNGNQ